MLDFPPSETRRLCNSGQIQKGELAVSHWCCFLEPPSQQPELWGSFYLTPPMGLPSPSTRRPGPAKGLVFGPSGEKKEVQNLSLSSASGVGFWKMLQIPHETIETNHETTAKKGLCLCQATPANFAASYSDGIPSPPGPSNPS